MAGDLDGCVDQAACSLTNGRERFGKNVIEYFSGRLTQVAFDSAAAIGAAQLEVDLLTLGSVRRCLLLLLELRDSCFELTGGLADALAKPLRL